MHRVQSKSGSGTNLKVGIYTNLGPVSFTVYVSLSTMIESVEGRGVVNRYAFLSFVPEN